MSKKNEKAIWTVLYKDRICFDNDERACMFLTRHAAKMSRKTFAKKYWKHLQVVKVVYVETD